MNPRPCRLVKRTAPCRGLCYWCGRPTYKGTRRNQRGDMATRDHLVPKAMGGSDGLTVLSCRDCNTRRGTDMTWLPFPQVSEAQRAVYEGRRAKRATESPRE